MVLEALICREQSPLKCQTVNRSCLLVLCVLSLAFLGKGVGDALLATVSCREGGWGGGGGGGVEEWAGGRRLAPASLQGLGGRGMGWWYDTSNSLLWGGGGWVGEWAGGTTLATASCGEGVGG